MLLDLRLECFFLEEESKESETLEMRDAVRCHKSLFVSSVCLYVSVWGVVWSWWVFMYQIGSSLFVSISSSSSSFLFLFSYIFRKEISPACKIYR